MSGGAGAERGRHVAEGYASDDEGGVAPARPRGGFGALPGDGPPRRRLSAEEVLDYGVRQASSGPRGKKARYLDAFGAPQGQRLSRAQTKPRGTYEHHCRLLSWLPRAAAAKASVGFKTDLVLLQESHRFLRSAEDDDGSWEAKLAGRYYERLFKEYVICDLAGYKTGDVGFRWRTEREVVQGKGQFFCGQRRCEGREGLRSYEVDFRYREAGQKKRALVKARLCEPCAYRLHYRRLRKRHRRPGAAPEEGPPGSGEAGSGEEGAGEGAGGGAAGRGEGGEGGAAAPEGPSEEERRQLEALAWRGPDPDARTREDEFDDYLADLFT
ncbi:unnamed protein product [Prorocentrum cordatum]|uniref:Protein FRA10AC1 n=1 Tax=Prorocentrum cordatum TaxID=2364126 RepID=A0ABN9RIF7_9DINO|nr:unnamed protein product [Polarella glacialis]